MNHSTSEDQSVRTVSLASAILSNTGHRKKSDQKANKRSRKSHKPKQNVVEPSSSSTSTRDYVVDKIIEKLIESQLPEEIEAPKKEEKKKEKNNQVPEFSLSVLASNIRKLNSKTKLLLELQSNIVHILSWHQPTATISTLLIYTVLCLNPHLLAGLPIICVLIFIMAPGYNSRHPVPDNLLPSDYFIRHQYGLTATEAETDFYEEQEMVKRELLNNQKEQRELREKLRDLQNALTGIVVVVEAFEQFVYGIGSFAHEKRATAIYILLLTTLFTTVYLSSFVNIKTAILVGGWAAIISMHPESKKKFKRIKELYLNFDELIVLDIIEYLEKKEIVIDDKEQDYKIAEVFEIQRQGLTANEWVPWVFSHEIYNPSSLLRKSKQRPPGTRFLQDIEAPKGWKFKKKEPWTVDTDPQVWLLAQGIQHVQNSVNGWVYDYYSASDIQQEQEMKRLRKERFNEMLDGDEYLSPDEHFKSDLDADDDNDELAMLFDGDSYRVSSHIDPGRGEWRRRRWLRRCYKI